MASSATAPNKATPIPAPLNCPRCDSSNTKFCYYNNYSLSQPRHFCKACKRYWTRGGTLRNVPVGGGCRKNKRPRRRDSPQLDPPSTHIQLNPNSMFYTAAATTTTTTSPLELNFPFSSFRAENSTGYDLHPQSQINSLGLGFSNSNNGGISNSPFSASNNSIFFGSSSSSPSATMASLLASTLQHQKFSSKDILQSPGLMPYEDPQMTGTGRQGENSRPTWNPNPNPNPIDQINSSDPSSLLWNTAAWFDPSSIGSSSVPSLI